jgi:hypothetical protein
MMVIAPRHVGAVLMSILMPTLKLFLRQFNCASVGKLKKNFDKSPHKKIADIHITVSIATSDPSYANRKTLFHDLLLG